MNCCPKLQSNSSVAKPENSFITGVHRYVQSYYMKNHNEYNGGIADVWYSGEKRDPGSSTST